MKEIENLKVLVERVIREGLTSSAEAIRRELSDLVSILDLGCDFGYLEKLIASDEWPQAVLQAQIADEDSEQDKDERAEGIADIILPSLDGKKFLDFGCGEGHVANYTSRSSVISVGYDIARSPKSRFEWEKEGEKILLTTDLEKVKSKGPFDVILLYDVMDHIQESTPQEVLAIVRSMLADKGRIYLRMHPWTSRHGGHAYRKMNKAFAHLVFTEEELALLGIKLEHNLKIKTPIATYLSWLKDSGLKHSIEPELDRQEVESFFRDNPVVRNRILRTFDKEDWRDDCPVWQMGQCFWDYVLEKD